MSTRCWTQIKHYTQVEILTEQPVTDLASAHVALGVLQRTGTNCVVLTLGEKGLLYSQKVGEGLNEWSAPEHIEAECVEVVDTTVREQISILGAH